MANANFGSELTEKNIVTEKRFDKNYEKLLWQGLEENIFLKPISVSKKFTLIGKILSVFFYN